MKTTVLFLAAFLAHAAEWSQPAEVRHEDAVVVSYTARVDGPYLVVRAKVAPGWHTFALDNVQRVQQKLAGKPALSLDRSTEIAVTGIQLNGPWRQAAPQDFSRPELRMFSFGYDHEGVFAAKIRPTRAASANVRISGQACTDSICKNVNVAFAVPVSKKPETTWETKLDQLVPVLPNR